MLASKRLTCAFIQPALIRRTHCSLFEFQSSVPLCPASEGHHTGAQTDATPSSTRSFLWPATGWLAVSAAYLCSQQGLLPSLLLFLLGHALHVSAAMHDEALGHP
eukprot:INCI1631.1.p1 GENE.INCI1631.1~~INCI1631.1.p1  ORF type:complete len:105 (+),score=2.70 INCI1631.1:92-406(+)